MSRILMVSKPVGPPWNDSSKNLVRDLALGMERHEPVVLGRRGDGFSLPRGAVDPVYSARAGGFAPALADNARVLSRLLLGRRADVWHFFFAPNPRTSAVARGASAVRRASTVQTVCSAPARFERPRTLFFADVTVVLSHHTEERLVEAGVERARLRRIAPAIAPLAPPTEVARRAARAELDLPRDAPLVVYPGDLEFGGGAELAVDALARLPVDVHLALACRVKTPAAREVERALRERVRAEGLDARTTWLGETSRIHALLGAADVVILPSRSLYAKMDHPLVLLEAMSMERAVIVAAGTPAEELAEEGGALAVAPDSEALSARIAALLGDDAERAALGSRAREHVLRRHDRTEMARAYEALYDALGT